MLNDKDGGGPPCSRKQCNLFVRSFVNNGYIPSFASIYVSLEHEDEHMHEVMEDICGTSNDVWRKKTRSLRNSWWRIILNSFPTRCFIFGTIMIDTRHALGEKPGFSTMVSTTF